MPNLKIIDVQESAHRDFYMACLRDLVSKVYLKHLKEITKQDLTRPKEYISSKTYFEACYNFRHTLMHLMIQEVGFMISIGNLATPVRVYLTLTV